MIQVCLCPTPQLPVPGCTICLEKLLLKWKGLTEKNSSSQPKRASGPYGPEPCPLPWCPAAPGPGGVCTGDEASWRPLPAHRGLPSTFPVSLSALLST